MAQERRGPGGAGSAARGLFAAPEPNAATGVGESAGRAAGPLARGSGVRRCGPLRIAVLIAGVLVGAGCLTEDGNPPITGERLIEHLDGLEPCGVEGVWPVENWIFCGESTDDGGTWTFHDHAIVAYTHCPGHLDVAVINDQVLQIAERELPLPPGVR